MSGFHRLLLCILALLLVHNVQAGAGVGGGAVDNTGEVGLVEAMRVRADGDPRRMPRTLSTKAVTDAHLGATRPPGAYDISGSGAASKSMNLPPQAKLNRSMLMLNHA